MRRTYEKSHSPHATRNKPFLLWLNDASTLTFHQQLCHLLTRLSFLPLCLKSFKLYFIFHCRDCCMSKFDISYTMVQTRSERKADEKFHATVPENTVTNSTWRSAVLETSNRVSSRGTEIKFEKL